MDVCLLWSKKWSSIDVHASSSSLGLAFFCLELGLWCNQLHHLSQVFCSFSLVLCGPSSCRSLKVTVLRALLPRHSGYCNIALLRLHALFLLRYHFWSNPDPPMSDTRLFFFEPFCPGFGSPFVCVFHVKLKWRMFDVSHGSRPLYLWSRVLSLTI